MQSDLINLLIFVAIHVLALIGVINYKYRQRNGAGLQIMSAFLLWALAYDLFMILNIIR